MSQMRSVGVSIKPLKLLLGSVNPGLFVITQHSSLENIKPTFRVPVSHIALGL